MSKFLKNIKDFITTYDLLPKVLSILLALILWANLQNSQIDEISYNLYPEIRNLATDLVIIEDVPKIRVTVRGRKEYLKSINLSKIKLFIDLSQPLIGKKYRYPIQIKNNEWTNAIDYILEKEDIELTIHKIKNKNVPIEPLIVGELSQQFKKGTVIVEPFIVKISGPEPTIDKIKMMKTYPINIANEQQTINIESRIDTSQYSKIVVYPDIVKVIIPISHIANLVSITVPIEIKNRNVELNYNLKITRVIVYLKKNANIELNENAFYAYINGDMESSYHGTFHMPVFVEKKGKYPFDIFSFEPSEVEITVTSIKQ
jgi:hypothetical protein